MVDLYQITTKEGDVVELRAVSEEDARSWYGHICQKPLPRNVFSSPNYYSQLTAAVEEAKGRIKEVKLVQRDIPLQTHEVSPIAGYVGPRLIISNS